jgi:hypothetical protein
MVVMLIVLVGLGTIAGLTVISMQSSQATTSNTQFNASGAVAAIDFLRKNTQPTPAFLGAFVRANNVNVLPEAGIPGNDIPSGGVGNLLSLDRRSSYTVLIFNNRADTGLGPGQDTDGIVVLHVTGRGPNGAIAELEWEVKTDGDVTHPLTILSSRQAL